MEEKIIALFVLHRKPMEDCMKTIVILFVALFSLCLPAYAGDNSLKKFISNFDYEARNDMKIDAKALIQLIKEGRA
jgi:hypothetical protein